MNFTPALGPKKPFFPIYLYEHGGKGFGHRYNGAHGDPDPE
jgi:hypothetical protein